MGLYILSYGIELAKLKQAFASKDEALFAAVCATETFDTYASQDFPGTVPTEDALRQIIYGESYNRESAHSYGYALIALCSYMGVDLNGYTDLKLGYETDLIDKYLAADFGIKGIACAEDLFAEPLNLGLPPVADFPDSGMLSQPELEGLHHQLASIQITDEQITELLDGGPKDEERGIAYEGIKFFKERIDHCYTHQINLISFCH